MFSTYQRRGSVHESPRSLPPPPTPFSLIAPPHHSFPLHCFDKLSMQIFTAGWVRSEYDHNQCSISKPPTTFATDGEKVAAAVFSLGQQPKQAALRVSSSCGQTAVVGGGAVWWWRENSRKNLVDLFSESEQAAAGQCVLSKKLLFHQTHSSHPPSPSP